MSLSSLLVQREIATIREIEEALARQVLYGGDLITNLLEVAPISEEALISAAADMHGLPPAPGGTLPVPSAEARQLVPGEVVATHGIMPMSVDRYGLIFAVSEPLSRQSEQELAFALAMPIAQRLTSFVRIREALSRDYALPLERRVVRLLARLRGELVASTSSLPPRMADVIAQAPRAPAVPNLHVPPQGLPSSAPDPRRVPQLLKRTNAPPVATAKRRRGPLTVEDARAELDEAAERDEVLNILFEFARQYFDYTAIFVVHGDVAEGRDAFGTGATREKVARIGVPLDLPGVLKTARDRRSLIAVTPNADGLDAVLMTDLGRPLNQPLTVMPVTVRTRVVALIVGDSGAAGVDQASVSDVLSMVNHASGAFERVILRKKLRGATSMTPRTKSSPAGPPLQPSTAEPGSRLAGVDDMGDKLQEMLEEPVDPPQGMHPSIPPTNVSPRAEENTLVSADAEPERAEWLGPRESIEMVAPSAPPANALLVRRPSAKPIPREEPESEGAIEVSPRRTGASGAPASLGSRHPRSHRAEAPALDFSRRATPLEAPRTERDRGTDVETFSHGFAGDEVERALLAEIHGEPSPASPPAEAPGESDAEPAQLSVDGIALARSGSRSSGSGALSAVSAPPPATTRDAEAPVMTPASPAARGASPTVLTAPQTPVIEPEESQPSPRAVSPPPPASISAHVGELPPTPAPPSITTLTSGLPILPVPGSSNRPGPPPSEKFSVPAHRPPSSRSDRAEALPSVIFDVGQEYVELVRRVVEGGDEEVESTLTRAGGAAMPAIMERFPGDDLIEPENVLAGKLPRVGECGRVLRLIAAQRRTALPFVLTYVEDESPIRRFWATFLLTELAYVESLDALVRRVFDVDERVRAIARAAGRASSEAMPGLFVERLTPIASDATTESGRRAQAIAALGASRDAAAVPILIALLSEGDLAADCAEALTALTHQDRGTDRASWARWWAESKDRHRIEWLIDALMSEHQAIRAAAGEELKATTREFFGYYDDLGKRERLRAQAKFREWWKTTGRKKFAHTRAG